jgi:NADH-quinone oxidoreductase subunit N
MERIDFISIAPEIVLLGGAVLVLMAEVTLGLGRRAWGAIAGAALGLALFVSVAQWVRVDQLLDQTSSGTVRNDALLSYTGTSLRLPMIVMDHLSAFAGVAIFAVCGVALAAAWRLVATLDTKGAEFVSLALLAIAGMHTMAISANLILLFIGLEVTSISLYVVAGFTRDEPNSDEAAMKYFLLGSFASAIFLYGIALVFAATGSLSIYGQGTISDFIQGRVLTLGASGGILWVGIALMIVGLAFKVTAAPFHQWAPDVYQGAPGGAVGLMAAGVKVAAFVALARLLVAAFGYADRLWAPPVAAIAALSVIVGTAFAIAQTDLRRMLAYSGVAHAGFILTALVAVGDGVPAVLFYVSTYAFTLVGAFTVTAVISGPRNGGSPLDAYRGLAARAPALAITLAAFMLSLGGIPLFAGFAGKVTVFAAAIGAGYLWLALVGLVASVAGLFFYLRVIVLMYFQEPADAPGSTAAAPVVTIGSRLVLAACLGVTIVFGVAPWPLLGWVRHALPF